MKSSGKYENSGSAAFVHRKMIGHKEIHSPCIRTSHEKFSSRTDIGNTHGTIKHFLLWHSLIIENDRLDGWRHFDDVYTKIPVSNLGKSKVGTTTLASVRSEATEEWMRTKWDDGKEEEWKKNTIRFGIRF